MIGWPNAAPEDLYLELCRRAERAIKTKPRPRSESVKERIVKERIVKERKFKNIRTKSEEIVEFDYSPTKCEKTYRVVALRKNLSVERGEQVLFDQIRYFFDITNDFDLLPEEVVYEARQRCNQENLIEQLKNGVRSLHAPVNTLNANWAYMVMASLGWSIKAWAALSLPISPRWRARHAEDQRLLLRMDFRTFLNAVINMPCQIVKTGRRVVYRFLARSRWQPVLFRLLEAT